MASYLHSQSFEDEVYDFVINDERTHIQTIYTTEESTSLARLSASLSIISSLLIIYLIRKSDSGLQTIYHRLMFVISVSDVISKLAIGLGRLPIPNDTIYPQIPGATLGNIRTCEAQGFALLFGVLCASIYKASLILYYLLSMKYRLRDEQIEACIEPTVHVISIGYSLMFATVMLMNKSINPTPLYGWCTAGNYPWWCTSSIEKTQSCILRGNAEGGFLLAQLFFMTVCTLALIMIVSLVLLVVTTYTQARVISKYQHDVSTRNIQEAENDDSISDNEVTEHLSNDHHHLRSVVEQVLIYFFANIVINIMPIIAIYNPMFLATTNPVLGIALATRHFQGLFDLMIFLYHKAFNIQRVKPELPFHKAVAEYFLLHEEHDFIFSSFRIAIGMECNSRQNWVHRFESSNGESCRNIDFGVYNESESSDPRPNLNENREASRNASSLDLSGFGEIRSTYSNRDSSNHHVGSEENQRNSGNGSRFSYSNHSTNHPVGVEGNQRNSVDESHFSYSDATGDSKETR